MDCPPDGFVQLLLSMAGTTPHPSLLVPDAPLSSTASSDIGGDSNGEKFMSHTAVEFMERDVESRCQAVELEPYRSPNPPSRPAAHVSTVRDLAPEPPSRSVRHDSASPDRSSSAPSHRPWKKRL